MDTLLSRILWSLFRALDQHMKLGSLRYRVSGSNIQRVVSTFGGTVGIAAPAVFICSSIGYMPM
jgi:hypothetical protein